MDLPRRTPRRSTAAAAPTPPTTPYVRPQQPTDSPAASLPTETLKQIFDYTIDGLKPAAEQAARYAFGRVAVHWWSVAEVNKRVVVKDSHEAERLATAILQSTRTAPAGIFITVEADGAGRGQRIASLVRACSDVEFLSLRFVKDSKSLGRGGDMLGKPLVDALQTLKKLERVRLLSTISLDSATVFRLLSSWSSLKTLKAPNLWPMAGKPFAEHQSLPALKSLEFPLGYGFNHAEELSKILGASAATLTRLALGPVDSVTTPGPAQFSFLLPIAPRLRQLTITDGATVFDSNYLEAVLDKLQAIKVLKIGFNGHDTSALFDRLLRMPQPESFTMLQGGLTRKSSLQGITADGTVAYLLQQTTLRNLRLASILPKKYWSTPAVEQVKAAALQKGVALILGV